LTQSITVSDCLTGIHDITGEQIFTVFPNPSSDYIEIRFMDDYTGSIQVLNDMGLLILSQKGQGKMNRINMHGLAKGMYFIKIQADERCYQQKIINL
jgi:hypothetical protein